MNFRGHAQECKQTTGTHRLSLWPGGRNSKPRALPSDTRSICKRQGWLLLLHLSPCWCFFRRKGKLTGNRSHIWMLWFSCHSPRLAIKLLSPHFSHGSDTQHCKRRKQGRKRNPHEPPCQQGWQPERGSAWGHHSAQVTAIPLRNHAGRFMLGDY